ncbi:MAG: hypothetical protein ACO2O4_01060 [Minisyncoccia bacterium]|jgi:hypothetical protein
MAKNKNIPKFHFSWSTLSHYEHPYGDLLWHLFWGIVIGASIIYSIIAKDFLFLVISLIGLFFFFHPVFYEPTELRIKLNENGIYINNKFYSWDEIVGFEIFYEGDRTFIYFVPKAFLRIGPVIPLEMYLNVDEIRNYLIQFLDEYEDSIPLWEILYRRFFY